MEFVFGFATALPVVTATGISVVTGVAQGVSEQKKQNADASNAARMLKFHVDVRADDEISTSEPRQRQRQCLDLNQTMLMLRGDKVWLTSRDPSTRLPAADPNGVEPHPFTGFYLAYPDDTREATRGLVSTISADPPVLNWIYVDRATHEVKYANRSGSIAHHVGSFDWLDEDGEEAGEEGGPRITFDGWEGFVAVEEAEDGGKAWALYFDVNDDGLSGLRHGRRIREVSLRRRVISEQEVNRWGLAGEGNIGFRKTREV